MENEEKFRQKLVDKILADAITEQKLENDSLKMKLNVAKTESKKYKEALELEKYESAHKKNQYQSQLDSYNNLTPHEKVRKTSEYYD